MRMDGAGKKSDQVQKGDSEHRRGEVLLDEKKVNRYANTPSTTRLA